MDCFKILQIEETKDVKIIRRAYSKLVKEASPEKDPEGFKLLRVAYEEAINKAKNEDDGEDDPIKNFIKKVDEVYRNYEDRLSIDKWQELLDEEICIQIDTSQNVGKEILVFLMNDFNIPLEVWQLLNNHFSWDKKKEELYKEFDNGFIDFVMYRINKRDYVQFEELRAVPDNKQDEFLELSRNISTRLQKMDLYEGEKLIREAMDICDSYSPVLLSLAWDHELRGKNKEAIELLNRVIESNPEYTPAYNFKGDLAYRIGELEMAYESYKESYSKEATGDVLMDLTRTCIMMGKYKESIEYIKKLGEKHFLNENNINLINTAYKFYVEEIEKDLNNLELQELTDVCKIYEKLANKDKVNEVINRMLEIDGDAEETYVVRLMNLEVEEKYQLAENIGKEAVSKYPNSHKIHRILGDVLDELDKQEEAVKEYEKSIELDPTNAVVYNNLSYCLTILKRYNEALEMANKAIEIDSELSYAHMNKGKVLLELGLLEECFRCCNEALNYNPYLVEAYSTKMKALISINRYNEVLRVYEAAGEYGVDDIKIDNKKAEALVAMENYEEASEVIEHVLSVDGENKDALYNKAMCLYRQNNIIESNVEFTKVIEKDPTNFRALYYKICNLAFRLGKSGEAEALKLLDEVYEIDVENKDIFYSIRGDILYNKGYYSNAIEAYQKAIDLNDTKGTYYECIGDCHKKRNENEMAIKYYDIAIKCGRDTKEILQGMVNLLFLEGRYEEVISYCENALENYKDEKDFYELYIKSLMEVNNLKLANEMSNRLLENFQDEHSYILKLNVLILMDNKEEALNIYENAIKKYPDSKEIPNVRKQYSKIRRKMVKYR